MRGVLGRAALAIAAATSVTLAGCGTFAIQVPTATPSPTPEPTPTLEPTPPPTPRPTPTPSATPTYTNLPDPELRAVIPEEIGGATVVVPEEIALTPGDVGTVFGEYGTRFRSLVIGFTEEPRLTIFAMRVDPPQVRTRQLRPLLPGIGQYLGISDLDPEAWTLRDVAGTDVWVREGDAATSPGTQVYTWAREDLVFLMIGTDEQHNLAAIAALTGVQTPTPS